MIHPIVLHGGSGQLPSHHLVPSPYGLEPTPVEARYLVSDIEVVDRTLAALVIPGPGWLAAHLGVPELHHLGLFLVARGAVVMGTTSTVSGPMGGLDMVIIPPEARPPSVGDRFPSLIGSPSPELLLLGDSHNSNQGDPGYRASFGPWAGCGPWLLHCLTLSPDVRFALANANEEPVDQLREALGRPALVALGRQAQYSCERYGVPYGVVPHPQWARRFVHRRQQEYADLLVKAAEQRGDCTQLLRG